jgi:hypothetical protein
VAASPKDAATFLNISEMPTHQTYQITLLLDCRYLILIVAIWIFSLASGYSQIITVKQDGTGDFSVIQEAVDASANGDTVLVYPGIYYENVDITDKGIVLASTWLITQQDSLIRQTIIDGNHQGSCIHSTSGVNWAFIIGFTLQHGTGTWDDIMYPYIYGPGGAIYLLYSSVGIYNCFITNNFGGGGGGIFIQWSTVKIRSNTITNNWSAAFGGGISDYGSIVYYDSLSLNNIYLNFSSSGSDIASMDDEEPDKIWLDTCTVINPDSYYIGNFNDHGVQIERPPISVLHGKIEQVNEDLYVNPGGNDANSGLTPDDPLKTISFALLKIASDSLDPKTVHVANGTYSDTLTGEHTPLQIKNHVRLIGESRDSTIIDCEGKYKGGRFAYGQDESILRDLTFMNGNGIYTWQPGGISTGYSGKLTLDSIAFVNISGYLPSCLYCDSNDSLIITNSILENSKGYNPFRIFKTSGPPSVYVEFISDEFSFNYPDTAWDKMHTTIVINNWVNTKMINCLFHNNADSIPPFYGPVGICLIALNQSFVQIANCTFADNTTTNQYGGAIGVQGAFIDVYNSIFYGNVPKQLGMGSSPDTPGKLGVYHSLVQDGQDGIINFGANNIIDWGEGNMDEDPVFYGSGEYPYSIDAGSPCIDAGTLNLPPWLDLPPYDLAGNPRIWGESVDMGAYEYGPWVGVPEEPSSKFKGQSSKWMQISPNPFSHGTYVKYELEDVGRINISVFNISGMKIKTLNDFTGSKGDQGNFYWDGTAGNGNEVPDGSYFIRMTIDGKLVESVKIIKEH